MGPITKKIDQYLLTEGLSEETILISWIVPFEIIGSNFAPVPEPITSIWGMAL